MNAPTWIIGLCSVLWVALIFTLDSRDKLQERYKRLRRERDKS